MDEKIVLIGAGSAMFTRGVVRDLMTHGMHADLALVDIDPVALDVAYGLATKMVTARNAPLRVSATLDRREVLKGATIVIVTIGVGKRRAWEQDVFVPRKYGLNYPVGDSVGPGGTSRALRMIPAMVAIARDVLELCPDALFFNYANPMSANCRAVHKATGAPMVGLCHGTWDTVSYLARELGVQRSDLTTTAIGINHCTWFVNVLCKGEDAMPALHRRAREILAPVNTAFEAYIKNGTPMPSSGSPFESSFNHPFSWQCLEWFGAFPAPLDRHVTEFFPQFFRDGRYYGKLLGKDEFTFEGTIAVGDRIYEEMSVAAHDEKPLSDEYFEKLGGEHEQVLDIIEAIRSNQPRLFYTNLPNTGQIPNLPLGVVVEAPAVTDERGLHALVQAPLPTGVAGALATRFQWVEATVEAALETNPAARREKFIQALILDGCVARPDQAAALADDLLEVQKAYL
jgi:alpha-galactosidase